MADWFFLLSESGSSASRGWPGPWLLLLSRVTAQAATVAGIQPAAQGSLSRWFGLGRAIGGVQPAASGALTTTGDTARAVSGIQPAAHGSVTATGGTPGAADVRPRLILEWSPTTNPAATPLWVDITARLRAFSLSRGRQHELDQFQAGTMALALDNLDRALDPTYEDGPWFGQILPMRRIRLSASYNGVIYPLFTGYVESWPQEYPHYVDMVVPVDAVDGFKVLSLSGVGGTFPEQRTDQRVEALLDDAGWPVAERLISTGKSDIQGVLLAQSSALSNLQDTEEVEQGRLFIDAAGRVVFIDRQTPIIQTTPAATFGDAGVELHYHDIRVGFDDRQVWNDVQILREGSSIGQQAEDATSQATFFKRTLRNEGVLVTDDTQALYLAQALLYRYKDVRVNIEGLTLKPHTRQVDPLWPVLLGLELGDMVDVYRRPRNIGDPIVQRSIVEAIRHEWSASTWEWITSYQLSSIENQAFWLLGVPGASELGVTTVLGY